MNKNIGSMSLYSSILILGLVSTNQTSAMMEPNQGNPMSTTVITTETTASTSNNSTLSRSPISNSHSNGSSTSGLTEVDNAPRVEDTHTHVGTHHENSDPRQERKSDVSYDDFLKLDIRSGTVVKVEPNKKAKVPAYIVTVDFGKSVGLLQTSAQVTVNYSPSTLVGKQVVGVINLGERRIGSVKSQFLMVGFPDETGAVSLVTPDLKVQNGMNLF